MAPSPDEVTELLMEWSNGEQAALDRLMPLVYEELRRIARGHMKYQPPGHTLQTTALIHEAYLKLIGHPDKSWQNRAHFFGVAAQAMRHILVDYARKRQCEKRGGGVVMVSLNETTVISAERAAAEVVALDDALQRLAVVDPRKSRVVEMRYFGGLSVEETAEVLRVSSDTIMRDWRLAKTWLRRDLSEK